jgi:hypothetical protein
MNLTAFNFCYGIRVPLYGNLKVTALAGLRLQTSKLSQAQVQFSQQKCIHDAYNSGYKFGYNNGYFEARRDVKSVTDRVIDLTAKQTSESCIEQQATLDIDHPMFNLDIARLTGVEEGSELALKNVRSGINYYLDAGKLPEIPKIEDISSASGSYTPPTDLLPFQGFNNSTLIKQMSLISVSTDWQPAFFSKKLNFSLGLRKPVTLSKISDIQLFWQIGTPTNEIVTTRVGNVEVGFQSLKLNGKESFIHLVTDFSAAKKELKNENLSSLEVSSSFKGENSEGVAVSMPSSEISIRPQGQIFSAVPVPQEPLSSLAVPRPSIFGLPTFFGTGVIILLAFFSSLKIFFLVQTLNRD